MSTTIWEIGKEVEEIHALLCACDAHIATDINPAPKRSLQSTQELVDNQCVQLLRNEAGIAIATISVTWKATFDDSRWPFPSANRPIYMRRLAVSPQYLQDSTLIGLQCVRRAIEVAQENGADVLRAETNPTNQKTFDLLTLLKFNEYGRECTASGQHRVFLQNDLL